MLHFNISNITNFLIHRSVWGSREFGSAADMELYLRTKAQMVAPPMAGQALGGIGFYRSETGQPRFAEVDGAYIFDTYVTSLTYISGQYSFALTLAISLSETLNMADSVAASANYATALAETMNMVDTLAGYRVLPVALAETVGLADGYDFKGIYGIVLSESLVVGDTLGTNASLVAYAVNQSNGAVTTYRNFNLNSYAQIGGKLYGMTDAGVVELTGDTDNGENIAASITLGKSDLSTDTVPSEVMKRLPTVYLGVTAAGDMVLKVTTNGVSHSYTLTSATVNSLHTGRMILGRGVESRYWDFELTNTNGADFTLDSIMFHPVALGRRIVEG